MSPLFAIVSLWKLGSYAVASLVVRAQLNATGGFDAAVIVWALVAGELVASLSPGGAGVVSAVLAAVGLGAVLGGAWNAVWTRSSSPASESLLVASLGLSALAAALVGLWRGPATVYVEFANRSSRHGLVLATVVAVGTCAAWLISALARSRPLYKLDLVGMSPQFASEIGVTRETIGVQIGMMVGAGSAGYGCSQALAVGSSPTSGTGIFLFGATGALVLGSPRVRDAALGGLIVALVDLGAHWVLPPSGARVVLYASAATIVLLRVQKRSERGER